FTAHAAADAAAIERLARRYARLPSARSAEAYEVAICERVRDGIGRWRAGQDVSRDLADAGLDGDAGAAPPVQRKAASGGAGADAQPEQVVSRLGEGERLDGATASRMGDAFQHGFGDVRVHADAGAGREAAQLGASAFTVGNHVAFAGGTYQ